MFSILRQGLARAARLPVAHARSYADAAPAAGDKVRLTFSTPDGSFFNAKAITQVNVPATSGDFGILVNHVPTIACLRPGVVTVVEDGKESKFFVSSGTVTVNNDSSVQIVAEEAAPLDQFDAAAAKSGLDQATQRAASAGNDADRAKAEIGVEVYRALVTALA
ncbi:ATP synthase subunit delta [Capsaspora owczarzaki ATCC 30864]|uniref:ATP synthase subunit delta n=1 Tax=Capsaspora owczarzaki (strain ATCC 30864) TaxID=595528 RepID=A0A0D2VSN5_CAPO3|nr:ATP synthase subunit delta [Capsaspora owczarzaki ATCC 30864]KJE94112.1 ATP synthase subunit delta [Capsaspora owczarzaki ATCC 30864]|eukprot:XP_004347552.1 ATP synthase subunit delta [Capsaspora owczarzaki ATCC 30864]